MARGAEHFKGSGVKLKLIIFGRGELKEVLERRVKEYGLEDAILMPGIAPMKDIVAISDIFLSFPCGRDFPLRSFRQ